jgi:CO/xanthine dehydrogenase FAD-binding subunit
MRQGHSRVFFPLSPGEFWADWNRSPDAALFSGSAASLQKQGRKIFALPETVLSLDGLDELRKIDRTERYLEIGSIVTLNKITTLGKIVPEALIHSLKHTATALLRNLTTLGSAICRRSTPEPVVAGLVALDSRYELRTFTQSRWISAAEFSSYSVESALQPKEYLARVRIPLETWDYTLCRDFSAKESGDNGNEFAVFLARIQKDILADVRLIFSGTTILRDKHSELGLMGKNLPLDRKTCETFVHIWQNHLSSIEGRSEFQKAKLLNFIEQAILYFAY